MAGPACSVPGCGAPAKVKGVCGRHYMRLRRHGDAGVTNPPGPKPLPVSQHPLSPFWSSRTRALYARASKRCGELAKARGEDETALRARLLGPATRANGTVNVAAFAREVDAALYGREADG